MMRLPESRVYIQNKSESEPMGRQRPVITLSDAGP